SGSIQPGGPSATPATSPLSGSFVSFDPTIYGQAYTAMDKVAGGLRSPNGANMDTDGNMYYADNQGAYVPSSTFIHVVKGFFYGHRQTDNPPNWAESMPYEPPTAWLPHGRVRKSPSQPLFLDRGFYRGDWLLGDVNDPGLLRIGIDRADGNNDHQNGAVFFFTGGFGTAALNRMAWNSKENSIVVAPFGTIAGNWPDPVKTKPTWKMTIADNPDVFEMKAILSRVGGLQILFTKPVDKTTAAAGAFTITQWNYHRTSTYGCCQDANESRTVSSVQFSNDGMSAFLKIDGLKNNHPGGALTDYVTNVKLGTIKSSTGATLFYNEAWYTLNYQSTQAFDPAGNVAVKPAVVAKLEKALGYRKHGDGLAVSVDLDGDYNVTLSDISGRVIGSRDGRGVSEFSIPTGSSRGLCFLRIRHSGTSLAKQVLL
ncbi:MAG: putative large multi-functional protein, partial [Fibrobacteres bacterium]|nr:putative large multi-functional protein [Fibrobacterota bacterium]